MATGSKITEAQLRYMHERAEKEYRKQLDKALRESIITGVSGYVVNPSGIADWNSEFNQPMKPKPEISFRHTTSRTHHRDTIQVVADIRLGPYREHRVRYEDQLQHAEREVEKETRLVADVLQNLGEAVREMDSILHHERRYGEANPLKIFSIGDQNFLLEPAQAREIFDILSSAQRVEMNLKRDWMPVGKRHDITPVVKKIHPASSEDIEVTSFSRQEYINHNMANLLGVDQDTMRTAMEIARNATKPEAPALSDFPGGADFAIDPEPSAG